MKTKKSKYSKRPCSRCGSKRQVTFGPDPYDSEIKNDYSKHFLCKKCYDEAAMEL